MSICCGALVCKGINNDMSELKTKENEASVSSFINNIEHPVRQQDAKTLFDIYSDVTGESPRMWGSAIIGFGTYSYINGSKKEVTWMRAAFSPRKQYMSLYLMLGVEKNPELLKDLGKFKNGKSCLNINKLADVDIAVLKKLVEADWHAMNEKYAS